MKKVIRLTEADLMRLVKRVINEGDEKIKGIMQGEMGFKFLGSEVRKDEANGKSMEVSRYDKILKHFKAIVTIIEFPDVENGDFIFNIKLKFRDGGENDITVKEFGKKWKVIKSGGIGELRHHLNQILAKEEFEIGWSKLPPLK